MSGCFDCLLIVPEGIEITAMYTLPFVVSTLLIVPEGIEIIMYDVPGIAVHLLIVPEGIEITSWLCAPR